MENKNPYALGYNAGLKAAAQAIERMHNSIILEDEYWNGARDTLKSSIPVIFAEEIDMEKSPPNTQDLWAQKSK